MICNLQSFYKGGAPSPTPNNLFTTPFQKSQKINLPSVYFCISNIKFISKVNSYFRTDQDCRSFFISQLHLVFIIHIIRGFTTLYIAVLILVWFWVLDQVLWKKDALFGYQKNHLSCVKIQKNNIFQFTAWQK